MNATVNIISPPDSEHNPCVRNCCLDGDGTCMGCGRTLPEILEWHTAQGSRQREILAYAKKRQFDRPSLGSHG